METKFNSQICTTREQGERLLALGLRKETADMHHWESEGKIYTYVGQMGDPNGIPAWSLHRLISTLTNDNIIITFIDNIVIVEKYKVFQKSYEFWDDVYDNICDAYEWLIKEGYFNKEYLV